MKIPDYEIVIYWSQEDQVYVAEVPELPGCAAHGDTTSEALSEVSAAIAHWLEAAKDIGVQVPEPKGRFAFS